MTQTTCPRTDQRAGYRHEAFLWQGVDAFLERAVPFVTDALDDQIPIMVALPLTHWGPLSELLGERIREVTVVDMTTLGRNPARIIPAWVDFIAANGGGDRPLRGIGEPMWAGRRAAELAECQIHEALLNVAVPADTPLWMLCPYDADALGADMLDEACRSHPTVDHQGARRRSHTYTGPEDLPSLAARGLTAPPARAHVLTFADGDLAQVRRLVARHAADAGITGHRVGDLVLGVNEVAANSLDHAGGAGVLRTWRGPDALVFEITDAGRIADLLVGRVTPAPAQARGRGLWMVNRLCDLVQIRSTPTGTVIRVVTWL